MLLGEWSIYTNPEQTRDVTAVNFQPSTGGIGSNWQDQIFTWLLTLRQSSGTSAGRQAIIAAPP